MKFIIEHLSKSFEKKEVLKDINFTFEEGKIYGLLGRNGAGKTTLFNCLNRDLKGFNKILKENIRNETPELLEFEKFRDKFVRYLSLIHI